MPDHLCEDGAGEMQFNPGRLRATALLAGTAILTVGGQAGAAPLDQGVCAQLLSEQAQLVRAGVKDSMARGPEWAGAGASLTRLKEIERLIEVEEQLMFRCPQPKPVAPAAEASDDDSGEGADKSAAAGKPGAAAVPAPSRKPKANDAYVPPPKAKPASGSQR